MKKTLFVQPRHIYAPPTGEGHVYTPTSLWTAGAKLLKAGADIDFADENLRPVETDRYDTIGVNLVGFPYVPVVRERFRSLLEKNEQQLLLGGQVIEALTTKIQNFNERMHTTFSPDEFYRFFGKNAVAGNMSFATLATDAKFSELRSDTSISLVDVYRKISDEDMREYLDPKREISFYLSQGCRQNCDFCPARRNEGEQYREISALEADLTYLTERAQRLGIHQLNMYLSNLDVFQTPEKLGEFASLIAALKRKYPGFLYRMRGLAITTSLTRMQREFSHILRKIVDVGFHTVGLGVDGGDNETRRKVHKGFVTDANVWRSMEVCREYGIQPESINVFGGPEETQKSIHNAVKLTGILQEVFGAVPRPHIFKDLVPGNKYWNGLVQASEAKQRKETMFTHPHFCQTQDFKADASLLTHPNEALRQWINEGNQAILRMCEDPRDRDSRILPIGPEFSDEINAEHEEANKGRYDR